MSQEDANASKSGKLPSLIDQRHFPPLDKLPLEGTAPFPEYYVETRPQYLEQAIQWCFLGEIVEIGAWPLRPTYTLQDRDGNKAVVAFYLDDDKTDVIREIRKSYQLGRTVAIMDAEVHAFMAGQVGFRIEDMKDVKLLPVSYKRLLELEKQLYQPQKQCQNCSASATAKCQFCTVKYCSRPCQVAHWKTHKSDCLALRELIKWNEMDWVLPPGVWWASTRVF